MKRLSYLLTLAMLFPTFMEAGSKQHHKTKQEREARKQQPVAVQSQPKNTAQERKARDERNRINAERNRKQAVPTVLAKTAPTKKKSKKQSFKGFAASWIKKQFVKHPLLTLAALAGGAYGFYKLYQMITSRAQNQPAQEQVECRLCEQLKTAQDIITIDGCNHTFCAPCLQGYINSRHRRCPALECQTHLCGNLCGRNNDPEQPCTNHIQPLRAQIRNKLRKQQEVALNNQNNQSNNQQQPSLTQMFLQPMIQTASQGLVGFITSLWS